MNQEIDINIKMRLIGYYMRDGQFMRTEEIYSEKAEELASLLDKTFQTILENRFVSDDMRTVFNGNTVFILKGENKHLYGYYPKYNIARITKVRYVKPDVVPFPDIYKRWFYPGERFHLYRPKEEKEILPSIPDSSI
jgi:hypothetical protein